MQIIHFRKIPDFNRGLKERWRRRQRERPKSIKFTPRSHCGIRYIFLRFDLRSARTVDLSLRSCPLPIINAWSQVMSTSTPLTATSPLRQLSSVSKGGGGGGWGFIKREAQLYLINTVTEKAFFQKRSLEWRFLRTPFCCTSVDGWKRSESQICKRYRVRVVPIFLRDSRESETRARVKIIPCETWLSPTRLAFLAWNDFHVSRALLPLRKNGNYS